jgi:hypothetical protein
MFERVFDMSKILKSKHARLARRIICVNIYSMYKFKKFKKMEKYKKKSEKIE